jgi:hypothetical protein
LLFIVLIVFLIMISRVLTQHFLSDSLQ